MRRTLIGMLVLGAGLFAVSPLASAHGHVGFAVSIGVPAYYAPPPVYYAPPPVYYAPPPVYYAPPPVYYAPPRVYYAPRVFGYRGGRIHHPRHWARR